MKKLIAFLASAILFPALLWAQAPQAISYQAVARDGNGSPLGGATIGLQISIRNIASAGAIIYQERHAGVTTNQFGLFTLQIGKGTVTSGTFPGIDWSTGDKFVQVELDPNNGTSYLDMGTTQLASVPYALFAAKSGGDSLIINGNQLSVYGGNSVTLPSGSGGGDNWGTQTVVTNSTLTGVGTNATPLGLAQQGALTGQTLKWNGLSWAPSADNNTTYTAGTGIGVSGTTISNTAPDQTVSLTGTGGTTVTGTYPNFTINSTTGGGNYTAGTGINISGSTISAQNTNAIWNSNELQGNAVSNTAPGSGQVLKWNGSAWAPAADASGSTYTAGSGINISGTSIINTAPDQPVTITGGGGTTVTGSYPNFTVTSNITSYTGGTGINVSGTTITNTAPDQTVTLNGSGGTSVTGSYPNFTINSTDNNTTYSAGSGLTLSGTTFSIAQQGASSGQVLQWNGTSWAPATPTSGGGTLNDSYNFGGSGAGRIITANNGAVEVNTTTTGQAAFKATTSSNGVAILATSSATNAAFSTIQSQIASNDTTTAAVLGSTSGAAWPIAGQVPSTATANAGVWGSNLRTTGGAGVRGTGFNGVTGFANNKLGFGIYGNNSAANLGLRPNTLSPGVNGIGFVGTLGQTITNDGSGVLGANLAPNHTGLYDNAGVEGQGFTGVVGITNSPGVGYGMLSSGDIGGTGDLFVAGNIDCGGAKLFVIDHPFDPANKFLRHFCIESNEILNIYRGNIELDANGEAIVVLPDYVAAVNRSFSYQLTAVGKPAPSLYIKSEMANNQFVIAGGAPNQKISWQMTAERNDVYMANHPEQRIVEMPKKAHQVGKYVHPLDYGKTEKDAIIRVNSTLVKQPLLIDNTNTVKR